MYYKYAVNSLARKLNQTKPEFGQLPENVEQCNICVPPTGERARLPTGARSQVASENRESRAGKAALKAATEPTQPQKLAERGGNLIKVRKS